MKPKQAMPIIFILIFILISMRCDTNEPPENKASLSLTLEDISCTEAWLKLTTTDIPLPASIVLKQNDAARAAINLTTPDTLLYIDSLLPKQTYVFQVTSILNPASSLSSNQATATTLDTTSHNFTWQTFTFGQHSSSVLYDVAIINENNIWAVGEIYMNDSLGNHDPSAYNAVHWDGSGWKLKRIYTYSSCSAVNYAPLKSIWAFSDSNFVVTTGGGIWKYNGSTFIADCGIRPLLTGAINKLWGSSSNDLYAVGKGGNIAHYNGNSWTKIASGTTVRLNDVWGGSNRWAGDDVVLVAASEKYYAGEKKILRIKNDSVIDTLHWPMQDRRIHSIWFDQHSPIFTAGGGVFQSKKDGTWREMALPLIYTNRIRGNASNDLIICGDFGIVVHYDGLVWKVFDELKLVSGNYESVAIKGDVVIASGWDGRRAHIVLGRR